MIYFPRRKLILKRIERALLRQRSASPSNSSLCRSSRLRASPSKKSASCSSAVARAFSNAKSGPSVLMFTVKTSPAFYGAESRIIVRDSRPRRGICRLAIRAARVLSNGRRFSPAYCCLVELAGPCERIGKLVGVVGIEFKSLQSKSRKRNGVAPPPLFNWSLLEPSGSAVPSCNRRGSDSSGFSR